MKSSIAFAIGLGFALLVASGMWASLFPATSSWTPEKAERWSEVKGRLYDLGFLMNRKQSIYSGPDPAVLRAEYETLNAENERLTGEFESAANRPNTIAKFLKWTGVSLAVIGIIGWYAVKNTSA